MAQRVFGPIRGAGVQITELEGQKTIEPGALGFVGYAGILEKGEVGALIQTTSQEQATKKVGGRIDDSLLPDAIEHYYNLASGAGGIMMVRVTDGNEQQAQGYKTFARTGNVENVYCRRGSLKTPIGNIKAKNGGRWGGARSMYSNQVADEATDITETTIDTALSVFTTDEWKGGYIELAGVPNTRYPIVGNTAAGIITVESDATMASDLAAGADPTNDVYYLVIDQDAEKEVSVEFRDGEEDPDNEFSMRVYVDGVLINTYPDLSTDPASGRYWVNVINQDDNNDEVEVEDLWTGQHVANVRPANYYGVISAVTATVLTATIADFTINSPTGGDPTFALGTTTDAMVAQKLTITMTTPTAGDVVSDRFGPLGSITLGTSFDPPAAGGGASKANKWCPPFTVTAGGTALVAADTLVINYKPFEPDALIGGYVYPDKPNAKTTKFRIVDNDHNTITAADGSDMTVDGAIADEFLVEAPVALWGGRDGIADLADSDYISQAWDIDSSPFNRVAGRNLGLIKFATPGVTATAVQKAGKSYAEEKNHQYRYEIPSTIVTEASADTYVNETLGRSQYAVVSFPSYCDIVDPDGETGTTKEISATGMIHGREARIASDFLGYHKAEAGLSATLPAILDLPTGEAILNEEILNPRGINVIKKLRGNYVLWGDRTLWLDSTWKWKHQREQFSYYEHVLQENFDFVVFALNSPETRALVKTALISFFLPEYTKGALDNDYSFEDAATIKIDSENNTPATKADGDMFVDILLRPVDTVERLRIRIGKAGLFEATA